MQDYRYDVLGLGAVAVDDILYVDEYPPAESKIRVRRRLRQPGGLTGNALLAAARLGARCAYGGRLGHDDLSAFIRDAFDQAGVDYGPAVVRDDARPAHSTIIVDQQHHTRTIFASAEGELGPDPAKPDRDVIRAAHVLLVDHHGVEGTIRAATIARTAGVAVLADVERHPGGRFDELLPLVDHMVISQRFGAMLTQSDDPATICRRLWRDDRAAVVVTCGDRGCWMFDGQADGPRHVPAFSVDVVDTTGCGDVFHGAYGAGLAWGWSLPERTRFAAATAAIRAAGWPNAPTDLRAAVDRLLKA